MKKNILFLMLLITAMGVVAQTRLERKGNTAHIVANGKPMLIIGGELGNSSASKTFLLSELASSTGIPFFTCARGKRFVSLLNQLGA